MEYADGSGGSYAGGGNNYVSSGTLLGNCNDYNYYSNGSGYYYQGEFTGYTPPPPPDYPANGTELSRSDTPITANAGCGDWVVGTSSSVEYADGSGGSYAAGGNNYVSSGTLLGNCNDYNYYADGNGGYYQGEYTGM